MKWLNENWFRIMLLAVAILFLVAYSYSLFLETKKHNLNVTAQMRICFTDSNFNKDGKTQCANIAKQQAIPSDFYKAEGQGFEVE